VKFDAYCASIQGPSLPEVAEVLASRLGGQVQNGKPMRRYAANLHTEQCGRVAAWAGLDPASGAIYVEGKGETTPLLADAIRNEFPAHACPRADVCEDYDEPGVFERLQAVVRSNKGPRVKGQFIALPDDVSAGRTWTAGVRGGVGYIRVYEAGKHPDRVHLGRPNWSRLELECRPHYSRDKHAAASMSPVQFWGLSAWTHRVGEAVTQTALQRFEPEIRRYSHDKTTRYIANTFRRHLAEMIQNGEDLTRTFQSVWQEEDQFREGRP